MTLTDAAGPDRPVLIDEVRVLVEPPGVGREIRRHAREQPVLLLFEEVAVHDRVNARGGAGDNARASGRRDRHQVAVSHAVLRDIGLHIIPVRGVVAALLEERAGVPVAPLIHAVRALVLGVQSARLNRGVRDTLKHLIDKGKVLLALPADAVLREHVVIAAYAKPDRAVTFRRDLGVRGRVEIEVYHVIERADDA